MGLEQLLGVSGLPGSDAAENQCPLHCTVFEHGRTHPNHFPVVADPRTAPVQSAANLRDRRIVMPEVHRHHIGGVDDRVAHSQRRHGLLECRQRVVTRAEIRTVTECFLEEHGVELRTAHALEPLSGQRSGVARPENTASGPATS